MGSTLYGVGPLGVGPLRVSPLGVDALGVGPLRVGALGVDALGVGPLGVGALGVGPLGVGVGPLRVGPLGVGPRGRPFKGRPFKGRPFRGRGRPLGGWAAGEGAGRCHVPPCRGTSAARDKEPPWPSPHGPRGPVPTPGHYPDASRGTEDWGRIEAWPIRAKGGRVRTAAVPCLHCVSRRTCRRGGGLAQAGQLTRSAGARRRGERVPPPNEGPAPSQGDWGLFFSADPGSNG